MKNLKQLRRCLLTGFFGLSLALAGCSGDDGAPGPRGPEGPEGPAGPVTETDESCSVCHGDGAFVVELGADHELGAEYFATHDVTITDMAFDATDPANNPATVTFAVADAAGPVSGLTSAKIGFAKLVAGTNGDADDWVNYKYRLETATPTVGPDGVAAETSATQGSNFSCVPVETATLGTYTCEVADLTPDEFGEIVGFEPTLTHRVAVFYGGHGNPVGQAAEDFVPQTAIDSGFAAAQAETLTVTRDIATIASCNECHGALAGHGGDRTTVKNCVLCHNPGTQDANSGIVVDMTSMIHKIHRGADLTQPYTIWGHNDNDHDFTEVLYPEALTNCEKCHTAADAETPDGDNWNTVPTMNACGSCHDDVDFATGEGHPSPGGIRTDNSSCTACHGSATIIGYHTVTPAAADTPEFDVTISMTPPANGTHYVTGEAPVVTVTLASGGTPVDGNVYTGTDTTAGVVGGGLADADLDVYGPRAHAVPVLGGGVSLLATSTDTGVTATSTGYTFQMDAITDDLTPGTYMVRFEGGDYGVISATDYVTMSTALETFQIGTATEEPKVAGDCTGCHGDNRMHLQGAHPHNAAFDTDECLACHDFSGGYGTPLVQRVHAVHSASGLGADGHDRVWTEITYPQDVAHCQTCHNSTSTAFTDVPNGYALACVGCHGDVAGARDHIAQNGGDI
ncbi:MAG: OmcA/MtrC family decaheme c-type cytochrome [Desulfurivibrionaceae bacterium]